MRTFCYLATVILVTHGEATKLCHRYAFQLTVHFGVLHLAILTFILSGSACLFCE